MSLLRHTRSQRTPFASHCTATHADAVRYNNAHARRTPPRQTHTRILMQHTYALRHRCRLAGPGLAFENHILGIHECKPEEPLLLWRPLDRRAHGLNVSRTRDGQAVRRGTLCTHLCSDMTAQPSRQCDYEGPHTVHPSVQQDECTADMSVADNSDSRNRRTPTSGTNTEYCRSPRYSWTKHLATPMNSPSLTMTKDPYEKTAVCAVTRAPAYGAHLTSHLRTHALTR